MHAGIMVSAKTIEHGQSLDEALRRGGSSFEAHFSTGVFDYISRNADFGEAFGKFTGGPLPRAAGREWPLSGSPLQGPISTPASLTF